MSIKEILLQFRILRSNLLEDVKFEKTIGFSVKSLKPLGSKWAD
jgi:hypothetical protein